VRVVSGTLGHFPIASVKQSDDFVIATLQTILRAVEGKNKSLQSFLKSAGSKLLIVFDEAHHSPAPSYRRLVDGVNNHQLKPVASGYG